MSPLFLDDALASQPDEVLGPLEDAMKERIEELDIGHAIIFRGAVKNNELPTIYQQAQIVVFPSIIDSRGDTEGFGLVMVEAMGCGCAVIASDLPAIHDSIIDGRTGLLVRQKDPRDISEKINCLLASPETCSRLSQQGRSYILERYDWQMTAKKYTDVFNSLA